MRLMQLTRADGIEATVCVVEETEKAILVKGNTAQAWFPKKAIDSEGNVAPWFRGHPAHFRLWEAPYTALRDEIEVSA